MQNTPLKGEDVISEKHGLQISNFFLQIMIHVILFLLYNVYLKYKNWIAV